MKLAYPIDRDGLRIGPTREFTDQAWEKLIAMPNLRWVMVESKMDLNKKTKQQLIDEFDLPQEDYKLLKSEIINKIQQ